MIYRMSLKLRRVKIIIISLISLFFAYLVYADESCGCGSNTTASVKSAPVASCCSAEPVSANTPQSSCGCGSPTEPAKQKNQIKETANPDMNCGVWSLVYIANALGVKKDEQAIKKLVSYDPAKGATMQELAQAAQKLGLEAKGFRMSYAELMKRKLPLIVYIPNHFTVLTAIDTDKHILQFADSSNKNLQISEMKFRDSWEGYVLEIKKKE
jgi:hypothetical protein